jgi:hypothetical protein
MAMWVGVSVAGFFGLMAIYFWLRPRTRPTRIGMTWGTTPVVNPGVNDRIAVSYDGVSVPRVSQTQIILRNFGGTTIARRHVHQPIAVCFPEGVQLLGAPAVYSDAAERAHPALQTKGTILSIDFDFMEPGDEIGVNVLSTMDAEGEPTRQGTVEGSRRGLEGVVSVGGGMAQQVAGLLQSGERRAVWARALSAMAAVLAGLLTALLSVK